jgi:hypothetical protein
VTRRFALLAALGTGMLCGTSAVLYLLRDPLPRFMERRSEIASVSESEITVADDYQFQTATITAKSGLSFSLTVRRQVADTTSRLPAVIILGGHLSGKEAARLVGETPGVLVAAVSYPFTGDLRPSKSTFSRQIPRIRAAFLDTPPALMLALDYLLARPDVDAQHVEGVGVSLGAPFMTIAGALDSRFSRVWAIHGSGGSYAPLEANMKRTISFKPARVAAAGLANVIIAGPTLAPERWVSRISPRPFIMVNATEDERLPRAAVDALYERASHPKEHIWMSGGHIHGDAPTIQRLVQIVLSRVRPQNAS